MSQMSGGGTLVTFELKGGKAAAFTLMNAFKIISISNNLGDTKSLATHPATTTHMRIGAEERAQAGDYRWHRAALGRAGGCAGFDRGSAAGALAQI